MYCIECGKKIESSSAAYCPYCGAAQTRPNGPSQAMRAPQSSAWDPEPQRSVWDPDPIPPGFGEVNRRDMRRNYGRSYRDRRYETRRRLEERYYNNFRTDQDSLPLNILSIFSPIAGFVMYLLWHNDYPRRSEGIKQWAVVGAALWIGFRFLGMIF